VCLFVCLRVRACVCVFVLMERTAAWGLYTHTHTHTHTHTYNLCTAAHKQIHHKHTHTHTCTTCAQLLTNTYTHMHNSSQAHTHAQCAHNSSQTYTRTHTQTHAHTCVIPPQVVWFYKAWDEWGALSNFSPHPIKLPLYFNASETLANSAAAMHQQPRCVCLCVCVCVCLGVSSLSTLTHLKHLLIQPLQCTSSPGACVYMCVLGCELPIYFNTPETLSAAAAMHQQPRCVCVVCVWV